MHSANLDMLEEIRAASRRLVRELGFMRESLAGTPYSASAVHAIVEIGARGSLTAMELTGILGLEKSSVSRMIRKLIRTGEIEQAPVRRDRRIKPLRLTARGEETLAAIHGFARQQVTAALGHLAPDQKITVRDGIALYAQALSAGRQRLPAPAEARQLRIAKGYRPGVIGRVAEMHARYYTAHAGFGQFFESRVASGMAELAERLANPKNGLWTLLCGERIVGSVAIDGEDLGGGEAHLRYFIVDEKARGLGAGRRLLEEAVKFCDGAGFNAIRLWTFSSLLAARALYERAGFALESEQEGRQWGETVTEQCFVRPAPV